MDNKISLIEFIKKSPSAYHTVDTVKSMLLEEGFTELSEKDISGFSDGGKHFVIRSGSSIIAFKGAKSPKSFMICASHTDTPTFKLTSLDGQPAAAYTRAAVERYGGMINYSWLDRPLSLAGRITCRTEDGVAVRLVNVDRDLMTIPSVAIHLNRTVNEGYKLDVSKDLFPLLGIGCGKNALRSLIASAALVGEEEIISYDLFLYNREEGKSFGLENEFIKAPRIDNLSNVCASLLGFINSEDRNDTVSLFAAFDNEEVGSETKQGAASTFLYETLRKISGSEERYFSIISDSFMVSADNAHAIHPNHPELSSHDAPALGNGVVVKYNASQRYTTDAVSDGIFRAIAESAGLSLQSYHNRPDMPGGSTLGSIANTKVSIPAIDIGIPQLAMHSASETMAVSDFEDMIKLISEFYSTKITVSFNEIKIEK